MKDTIHPVDIDSGLADQRASIVAAILAQEALDDTLAHGPFIASQSSVGSIYREIIEPEIPMVFDERRPMFLGLGLMDALSFTPGAKPGQFDIHLARVTKTSLQTVRSLGGVTLSRGVPEVFGRAYSPDWASLPLSISREHFSLTRVDPAKVIVRDLVSTNKTYRLTRLTNARSASN